MTRRTCSDLHCEEGGAISVLAVLTAAMFACLLLLVMNTGRSTSGKIQLQNAADVTALSSATWAARGLNLISLNNVTEAQLLSIALLLPALESSFQAAEYTLAAEAAVVCVIPPLAVLCGVLKVQEFLAGTYYTAAQTLANTLSGEDHNGALWVAARALNLLSGGIKNSFVLLAEAEAVRLGLENGASVSILVPSRLSPTLPVHNAAFRPDLCTAMRDWRQVDGQPLGYLDRVGYSDGAGPFTVYSDNLRWSPLFLSIVFGLVQIYFEGFREYEFYQACGGTPGQIRQPVSEFECMNLGVGDATYARLQYRTRLFPRRQSSVSLGDSDGEPVPVPPPLVIPCRNARFQSPQQTRVEIQEIVGKDADGRPIVYYRYDVEEYRFIGATKEGPPSAGQEGSDGEETSDDPGPYLLGGDADDEDETIRLDLRYLSVLYRPVSQLAPTYFVSPVGEHRVAYAQAKVYNPTAFDTFTQNWRVAMEPAEMLEDGLFTRPVVGDLLATVPGAGWFGRALSGAIALFNNH